MASTPPSPSPTRSPAAPLSPLLDPLHTFFATESAGSVLLLAAALVALVCANSPLSAAYLHFWHTPLTLSAANHTLAFSPELLVNDFLMVPFFLLVGLEIKRELLLGELASPRKAALPVAAALGGMVVPALCYALLNHAGPGRPGWGIPMATDIAFAVGVLALVGRGVPTSVKVFLLAVAIVDDLGAVLVIALFYTPHVSPAALAVAAAFLAALVALNLLGVRRPHPYLLLGIGLWAATLASGVHATVAGVLLAFTLPATRRLDEAPFVDHARSLLARFERDARATPDYLTPAQAHALDSLAAAAQAVQSPLARVEHALHRPVALFVIPCFALASAGVRVRGDWSLLLDPVSFGIAFGLVLGKPVGILSASWLAIKSGLASPPEGSTTRQLVACALLCGIGFTMSLFLAALAFPTDAPHLTSAKAAILLASLASALAAAAVLRTTPTAPPAPPSTG